MQEENPVIKRIFKNRNIDSIGVKNLLSWDLHNLPDMTSLSDLDVAVKRIVQAIEKKERIGIFGDYDVDGTTACAFFHHFFKMIDIKIETMQPNRLKEGYGLHISSIDEALKKEIAVLITVDCGITNGDAALYAKKKGIDLIITDHHKDIESKMPDAFAVVNPNRRDSLEDSPLRDLAGVGVAFALAWRIREKLLPKKKECPSLYPLLPFVAIGTVCDMVKLSPMNLKLVRHGLKELKKGNFPGLAVFLNEEDKKREVISSDKLSFNIGPLINAKGRLDHPERALQLLTSQDSKEAFTHYAHLEIYNNERKAIQAEVFKEAKEQILNEKDTPIACLPYASHWHEGVIGIVASKLVEEFRVPAVVFTETKEKKGILKASARTAGNMNLFSELKKCSDLFSKFGGHIAAAGLSMPKENLTEFRKRFTENLKKIPLHLRTQSLKWDCEISPTEITPSFLRRLECFEPFGSGNPRPVFLMRKMKLNSFDVLKDIHVRWNFANIKYPNHPLRGISFHYLNWWGRRSPQEIKKICLAGGTVEIVFTLEINRFRGNEYIQLHIKHIDTEIGRLDKLQ